MDHVDHELRELLATAQTQGYLTYDQVNDYLPDEAASPAKLDELLIALEDRGVDVIDDPHAAAFAA